MLILIYKVIIFKKILTSNFYKILSPIYPAYNLYPIASCRYGIELALRSIIIKNKKKSKRNFVILPVSLVKLWKMLFWLLDAYLYIVI